MQKKNKKIVFIAFALLALLSNACSTTPPGQSSSQQAVETGWQFHTIVDAAFVEQHLQIPMAEDVMLIDSRPKRAKYDGGHIPMAVSIPDSEFETLQDKLPADKNVLLIFYCGGLQCKLSHNSARKAEALGYTNVKVFAAGFPDWMAVPGHYASVSADWMKKQIDAATPMTVVDSRPKRAKYDKGHMPSAISIPDNEFEKHIAQLPADKASLLVFYCGGLKCNLSHKSAAKSMDLGYTNVKVFSEGFPGWLVVAAQPAAEKKASAQLKAGKEEGSIDHALFKKIIAENPSSIYLVDVRDKDEFARGSIKSAVNIPVNELEKNIVLLPTDKPIVFICGTGARSGESFYMLQDIKPELKNVYYLDGEVTIHSDGTFIIKEPV